MSRHGESNYWHNENHQRSNITCFLLDFTIWQIKVQSFVTKRMTETKNHITDWTLTPFQEHQLWPFPSLLFANSLRHGWRWIFIKHCCWWRWGGGLETPDLFLPFSHCFRLFRWWWKWRCPALYLVRKRKLDLFRPSPFLPLIWNFYHLTQNTLDKTCKNYPKLQREKTIKIL